MDRSSYNRGGGGGSGRGRGGGDGGGRGRGGGRDRGGGGGRGRGGGGNYQHQQQYYQHEGQYQGGGGGRGGGGGGGRGWGPSQPPVNPTNTPPVQPWGNRPVQSETGGGAYRPPVGPTRPESSGRGAWGAPATGRSWASITQPNPAQRPPQHESSRPDMQSLKTSEQKPLSVQEQKPLSLPDSSDNSVVPIKRPDRGGTLAVRSIKLLVNHFPVAFNSQTTIIHYDVDIKPEMSPGSRPMKKSIPKSDMRLIMDKLFSDNPDRFPIQMTAYDGGKNIFSAVPLPTGKFNVGLSDGEGMKIRSYIFTINFVNELKFSKLKEYLIGNLSDIPRDILQGMDLVMKEHPSRHRITFGRSTYSTEYRTDDNLRCGVAAYRGFQQSLKPTSQGLALCLDYSVLAFRKPLPVIDFLMEHVGGLRGVNDIGRLARQVNNAIKGLKVYVTHRVTKQKFTIAGLTRQNTKDLKFTLEDPEGRDPPREISLVNYFMEKHRKEILYTDIPCLDVGKNNRTNYVPMEFCVLVEGQRYPKEQLDKQAGMLLKNISLPSPRVRKNMINQMLQAEDGPCGGDVIQNFGIGVNQNMTNVVGRVIGPPDLRLGGRMNSIRVDKEKCQWNLVGKSVVEGIPIDRWALIDFSSRDRFKLIPDNFIPSLMGRCRNLGIRMEEPLVCRFTDMNAFSDVNRLRQLLEGVKEEASRKGKGCLQIIVCPMATKHEGYKYLKWVSETQVGVVTQCCLSSLANKGNDQYLANLAMKINAKLGGSNFELNQRLPRFEGDDHVMFIGADVNHPGSYNSTCPSIAAVVATVNWPSVNRYAARVCPQDHRTEKILNFGTMCLELVNTYARINKVKPKNIVVYRDGVSEGQFGMVLKDELTDLKRAIYEDHYRPTITLVVAQKRHQTRLFPENERDGGASGNVPPGTVVDTVVVHPFEFDFYLCSHYGGLGTSKPTHYYVLYDDHHFTSDQLQKLTYDLCFTFARCTKPVSLVPPVYYADLVAYRGRMFQEVVMSLQPTSSASSSYSVASSSSSTLTDSFNDRFYKLHPDLQNIMFFV